MKLLTKDQILGADDCETVEVETPEWGAGSGVLIKAMTGCERDSFELSILNLKGKGKGKGKTEPEPVTA